MSRETEVWCDPWELAVGCEFLRAFLIGVVVLGVRFVGGVASHLAGLAAEGNALQQLLAGFGSIVSLALLIYAAIMLVLGISLLPRQNWPRLATMFFSAVGLLLVLPRGLHRRPVPGLSALLNLAMLVHLWHCRKHAAISNRRRTSRRFRSKLQPYAPRGIRASQPCPI